MVAAYRELALKRRNADTRCIEQPFHSLHPLHPPPRPSVQGHKAVVFGVPDCGKVCSETHVPSYLAAWDELRRHGVTRLLCVAVGDPAAADAWARSLGDGVADGSKVQVVADPNAGFTRFMGMEQGGVGAAGARSLRYAALVDDGILLKVVGLLPLLLFALHGTAGGARAGLRRWLCEGLQARHQGPSLHASHRVACSVWHMESRMPLWRACSVGTCAEGMGRSMAAGWCGHPCCCHFAFTHPADAPSRPSLLPDPPPCCSAWTSRQPKPALPVPKTFSKCSRPCIEQMTNFPRAGQQPAQPPWEGWAAWWRSIA